ncbi:thiol-disulfide oxidoreductase DCC family protein [Thalassotalea agarivorans]|uniref:Predicted thiol-disulfide oxidoreductase YuxK, DCC family n=1 Tax=Thalassotalea agarivorans TaxID=349064 RepID=A0A1I0CCQ9_THASX|nr:DUF393 domain-containing protein [Thalassotalea agarivorans]SET17343.1 Predicted thiol-disulfide oxidoreductase YuxK, DCC family [Thalassotalea agarivorans]
MLTFFYDSQCPLCVREVDALRERDKFNDISFVDVHDEHAMKAHEDIDKDRALNVLHGKINDTVVTGLDVTYHAWRVIGYGCLVAPLQWRFTKPLFERGYTFFAKRRHKIARFLYPNDVCENGVCEKGSHNE